MSKSRLMSMTGAKGNLFTLGIAGKTHTVDYTTKEVQVEVNSDLMKRLLEILPSDEIWCFSKNAEGQLEICRMVDIDFKLLER